MYAYIARQPICGTDREIRGYELFYRSGSSKSASRIIDGDAATRSVLSEAVSVFGLDRLTDRRTAYIHFTRNLVLNDFVRLADPREIAVEVMADISADQAVIRKLEELRKQGYTLVLSGYDGDARYNPILPLVNIVRVNFRRFKPMERRQLARKLLKVPVNMLAERIETRADFEEAREMGCLLFQGYFFGKPRLLNMHIPALTDSPYGRLLQELLRPAVNFESCAQLIHSDAALTYLLLQRGGYQDNIGGDVLPDIRRVLVQMGQSDLLRYAMLLLAWEHNAGESDELIRQACLRGLFLERLMEGAGMDGAEGFLLGMFSLLDRILDTRMDELVEGLGMNPGIRDALTGAAENSYTMWLQYVMLYEMQNPNLILPELPVSLGAEEIRSLYEDCSFEAEDQVYDLGR